MTGHVQRDTAVGNHYVKRGPRPTTLGRLLLSMVAFACLWVVGPLATAPALAQAEVNALYEEAMAAMETKDFATAAARFDAAYALSKSPVLLWNAARAHHKGEAFDQAKARYNMCLAIDDFPADKRQQAAQYLVDIELELKRRSEPPPEPDPPATPDPVVTPPPTGTGSTANPWASVVHKTPEPAGVDTGLIGWITVGAGAALVGSGLAMHFIAEGDRSDVRSAVGIQPEGYISTTTQAEAFAAESDADTLDTAGIVTLSVGVAAVGAGVVLLLLDGADAEESDVTLGVSPLPGGAGVSSIVRF